MGAEDRGLGCREGVIFQVQLEGTRESWGEGTGTESEAGAPHSCTVNLKQPPRRVRCKPLIYHVVGYSFSVLT